METAVSYLSVLPQTKSERKTFVERCVDEILSGYKDPLEIEIYLKNVEETIEAIRKDIRVKDVMLSEASKYDAKTFDFNGNQITIANKSTFDYSQCNDSTYEMICQEELSAKDRKKARETFLKSLPNEFVDTHTGEVILPPTQRVTSYLTIKLK